jgi:hypothetical protein
MQNIYKALVQFQAEVPTIAKNNFNPHFKSKFADLVGVIDAVGETLKKCQLGVNHSMRVESGRMMLATTLFHASGETISSEMMLPDIQDPQKIGSAITYYRRYQLMAVLGVAPDADDDGNAASHPPSSRPRPESPRPPQYNTPSAPTSAVTPKQLSYIKSLAERRGEAMPTILTKEDADREIKRLTK